MERLEKAFKREISLQRFSVIRTAISFWDQETIKDKIRDYFSRDNYKNPTFSSDKWCEINDKVLGQLDSVSVPTKVSEELKDAIYFIGEKIFNWSIYVINDLGLDFKYAGKIFWTNHGTIDESKIFETIWKNDKDFHSSKKCMNYLQNSLFTIACIFGQGKFIRSNLKEITEAVNLFRKASRLPVKDKWEIYEIMAVGIHCFLKDDDSKWDRSSRLMNQESVLLTKQMLGLWCSAGCYTAVKYLISEHREIFKWGLAETMDYIFRESDDENESDIFKKEKEAELFLFILNFITVEEKDYLFFRNRLKIASLLVKNWPFQDFFLPIFNYMLDSSTKYKKKHFWDLAGSRTLILEDVLPLIKECLLDEFRSEFDVRKKTYFEIFKEIWKVAPANLKKIVFVDQTDFVRKLYDHDDYDNLTLIVNDIDLKDHREKLINLGDKTFFEYVQTGKLKRLNIFIQKVLIYESETEIENFKNKFNFLFKLVLEENFEAADDLLDWLTDSQEEKMKLKREINPLKIFYGNEKFNVKVVDRMLTWQFGSDPTLIRKVINIIKTDDLIRDEFCKAWSANCNVSIQSAKKGCLDVLKWFSEDPETLHRIPDDPAFLISFCKGLQSPDHFETIDEFLLFCGKPPDDMKRKIGSNASYWIEHLVSKIDFRIVNKMVDWCFSSFGEKKDVIGKYMNSQKGAWLCVSVLNRCSRFYVEPVLILFNSWVKQYGDIPKMMKVYDELKFDYDYIKDLKKLLVKVEKREFITAYDVMVVVEEHRDQSDFSGDEYYYDYFKLKIDSAKEKEYDELYSKIFS